MSGPATRRRTLGAALIALATLAASPDPARAQQQPRSPQQSPQPQQPPTQANICEAIDPGVAQTGISTWIKADERQQGPLSILELVPRGQTNKDWTDMLTIQTFGQRTDLNVHGMIDNITNALKAACGKLESIHQEDKQNVVSVTLLCRDPDPAKAPRGVTLKKNEVMSLMGMRGLVSTYLITRTWHSDNPPRDSIMSSEATRKAWKTWADSVSLCSKPCAPNAPNPCLPAAPPPRR